MKKRIPKMVSKLLRVFLIVFIVFFIENGSKKTEYLAYTENLNRTLDLTSMAEKVEKETENDLFAALDTFAGDLTGYSADCPLCNGKLACRRDYDVYQNGVTTYNDTIYGEVMIVAASQYFLPCGSIVTFSSPRISDKPVIAIVLDRGVSGKSLDLLTATEELAYKNVGRSKIIYDVLRMGWER